MNFSQLSEKIFSRAIEDYHVNDCVDSPMNNPYPKDSIEYLLYCKNWIDTVQWHLEDIIRNPDIAPGEALRYKRRIDQSNQDRTDLVEQMDEYFYARFLQVPKDPQAQMNTETPAWAIDRLSILNLKIYHMQKEAVRTDATSAHREACERKLRVLEEQNRDLSEAIDRLLDDLQAGRKKMRLYKQMKMYNDPALNPVLYKKSNG